MKHRNLLTVVALFLSGIWAAVTARPADPASERPRVDTHGQHSPLGVCPPFHLRDEDGNVIDPVSEKNANRPYSPAKTCGQCHDYEKITKGYHFTQGRGEKPTADQVARCLWASTPGNYGGTWCSPAPLYRYLSPKKNASSQMMDMTSFSFLAGGCGGCHPGGGSAEFDRAGKRYDRWMGEPASGLAPGADNDFDGDYYQARWSETGVLEADCLLCHLPEYDFPRRKRQLAALNFRWAPTAAAGFASVTGSVAGGEPPIVAYDKQQFNPDGTISPHIVRQPRNEACLACHAKPGWKKRGANFRARTDVHLRAGLKCVDCHPAGSSADDPRIRGHQQHDIGKGDDPGGHVRDDLDDTCVSCTGCHDTGRLGAPIAKHRWLPPLHLEKIACQTCHIPQRTVKAVQFVASDVFNPGTKIPTKGKHLWTFYGPDVKYWNHYGDLMMMGYDDKPTDPFRPVLARYKGKIYPVNRIHSTWPAIEVEGETALMQPKMGSVYKMWTSHHANPATYPALAKIDDDNDDGVPEINRPEEIDAIIRSVTQMLGETRYPMEGKRVVWVMNDRVYSSGSEHRLLEKHAWEASPYANVHKYNHGIYPATAALGARGCTDCHHPSAKFLFADVLKYPFDEHANPVTEPQYRLLGLSGIEARMGAWREAYLKPAVYVLMTVLILAFVGMVGEQGVRWMFQSRPIPWVFRAAPSVVAVGLGGGALLLLQRPALIQYMLPSRFWLDANHFFFAAVALAAGCFALMCEIKVNNEARMTNDKRQRKGFVIRRLVRVELAFSLGLACLAGALMLLKMARFDTLTRASYTAFDLAIGLVIVGTILSVLAHAVGAIRGTCPLPAKSAAAE
ncbi:MAG: hypothetical protein HQ567_26185 [Candidatus Nealsonbacteria bacterium]|nr:hypothetical protein [Candidatus Nealsonbacteria bacterium]